MGQREEEKGKEEERQGKEWVGLGLGPPKVKFLVTSLPLYSNCKR